MKSVIFNGSPRGEKSNTKLLMDSFLKGFENISKTDIPEIHYLQKWTNRENHLNSFQNADFVILAFPLYTDAMPGIVKYFIEGLEKFKNSEKNPAIGFVVQSGFPEVIHSRYIEKYLVKLCKKLNSKYLGTVIKGGVEGMQIMPSYMTKKTYSGFQQLGEYFAKTQTFDEKVIKNFAKKEKMSQLRLKAYKIMQKTGLTNFYWDSQLKKNQVFENRFATPFVK